MDFVLWKMSKEGDRAGRRRGARAVQAGTLNVRNELQAAG